MLPRGETVPVDLERTLERYEGWEELLDRTEKLLERCRDRRSVHDAKRAEAARLAEELARLAADLREEGLRGMEDAFITSSRYELLFWEMAWRQERWRP